MKDDRTNVCKIISKMLDNPDKYGIYPTTIAYDELIDLIESARHEALGWMHAEDCITLDKGDDPRKQDVAEILPRAIKELTA